MDRVSNPADALTTFRRTDYPLFHFPYVVYELTSCRSSGFQRSRGDLHRPGAGDLRYERIIIIFR